MKSFLGFVAAISFFSFAQANDQLNYLSDPAGRKIEIFGRCDAMPGVFFAESVTQVIGRKKLIFTPPTCKDEMRLKMQRCVCSCEKKATATIINSTKETDPSAITCLSIK